MNSENPATAEQATTTTTARPAPRHLNADHPVLMRAGIITFLVGMVNAILFGILTETFTHEAAVLDNFRRVGLGIMLVGMVLVLWCFPTARYWIKQPAVAWTKLSAVLTPAGRLIALYCTAVVFTIGLAFILAAASFFEFIFFLGLPYACMLIVWCIWGPGSSRALFIGVLLTGLVLLTPLGFDIGRRFGWYGYGEFEAAIWFSMASVATIICGFAGWLAYWIAKKMEAESRRT